MSRADDIFDENIRTILNSGYSTINDKVMTMELLPIHIRLFVS